MANQSREKPLLLDIAGIATLLRISPRTAQRLVREPDFPSPVRLRGCIRWWKRDVLKHVRDTSGAGKTEEAHDN